MGLLKDIILTLRSNKIQKVAAVRQHSTLIVKRSNDINCVAQEKKKKIYSPHSPHFSISSVCFVPWQIHAKLTNATASLQHEVKWVSAANQVSNREKKDKWEQSDRFEC